MQAKIPAAMWMNKCADMYVDMCLALFTDMYVDTHAKNLRTYECQSGEVW